MAIKVLVVDDSSFFRRRVTEILNSDPAIEVIDSAVNGKDAVEKCRLLKPDVVTMDIEMPVMNGIEAVKAIMSSTPTAILMFSSLTYDGAKATLDALEAGAADFLPKKFEDVAKNKAEAGDLLKQRVKAIGRRSGLVRRRPSVTSPSPTPTSPSTVAPRPSVRPRPASDSTKVGGLNKPGVKGLTSLNASGKYKIMAIGTSTGGPVALQTILTQLPADFPYPILLIQHMPPAFTPAFASRLNSLCKITVKEAVHGDNLKPGVAYLAPGGKQMLIDGTSNAAKLKIMEDDSPRINYKPSVDITFGTAAKVYGGAVLSMILTGMGADGREGARLLKARGATIWAQDEASCVVYGMPQAVASAGLVNEVLALNDIAKRIMQEVGYG